MENVPGPAQWLGLAGALPIACLAIFSFIGPSIAGVALMGCGVVILSVMGGIHWGLALAQDQPSLPRLGASVLPALLVWGGHFFWVEASVWS